MQCSHSAPRIIKIEAAQVMDYMDTDEFRAAETKLGAWSGNLFWVATPSDTYSSADLGSIPGPHR